MRINQVYSAFGPLGRTFREKIGIFTYLDLDQPVVFFGCYGNQIEKALKNNCFVVIIWTGGDIVGFMKNKEWVEAVRARDNIKHIAISNFIAADLEKLGFPYKMIPIAAKKNDDIESCPLGDSIYLYKEKAYGGGINAEVKRRLPHINFISCNLHTHDREGILDVYRQCFMGLRPIVHDGLSNTAVELGLMGRPIVWNGNTPNALNYENVDDIVAHIERMYSFRETFDYNGLAESMREYLDCEDFLDTDIWT
jgi:hypothetical protein